MPRKKRIWYQDATYHVMSRGNRRTAIFQNDIDYADFLGYLLQIREKYAFKVHAICLMTNHFHVCLQTMDTELWRIMQKVLSVYAEGFNHRYHFTGHLFEGRYTAQIIEDERYFLEVSRYTSKKCRCTDYEIIHYRGKISGPILERIDIQKSVAHVDYFDLNDQKNGISSKELRESVEKARKIQQERFKDNPDISCNAQMTTSMIRKYCKLDEESTQTLKKASEKYGYSARVIYKLLRLARTAADLNGAENIQKEHIVEVLGCRDLDVSSSQMYTIS